MKPLSIAIVTDDFDPPRTGVGTVLQPVCRAFQFAGHRVTVLTTRAKGQPRQEIWNGIQIHRFASVNLFGFLQAIPDAGRINSILREAGVDLVYHNYLSLLAWSASRVTRRRGIRQAFTFHMTIEHLTQPRPMKLFRPLLQRAIDRFCSGMDVITAPSPALARELSLRLRRDVVPVGNPLPDFSPASSGKFVVLFVGRLDEEKNVPLLIRGFAGLKSARADCELWIAGAGRRRGDLERLSVELGIRSRTRFLGWVDPLLIGDLYSKASVFVLPSRFETLGQVAAEAMRFGLPVIMCRQVISSGELIEEGVNGFLVDAEDDPGLAKRLIELHDCPELRRSMGEAGKERVALPGFSISRVASGYLELFLGLVNR